MASELQKIVVLCVVAVAVGAGVWWYFGPAIPQDKGPVACTADAMQCPDGSWVGRTGPNCEFVCPDDGISDTDGGAGGGGILPYRSGVKGAVMTGPTCPVERIPPDPACADRPYTTSVAIYRASDLVHAFVVTQSDVQGIFEVSLPPGDYTVSAGESALPRCETIHVTVPPEGYTTADISCDTGIR